MITAGQRNKMKKVFKTGYSKEVQKLLEEKGIWNKKGLLFSKSYITLFLMVGTVILTSKKQ